MTNSRTYDSLLFLSAILLVSALAYFVLPGSDWLAFAIGVVVGWLVAAFTFARQAPAGASRRGMLSGVVAFAIGAILLPYMTGSELSYIDLGAMRAGIVTMSFAVSGLLAGAGLRTVWIALRTPE